MIHGKEYRKVVNALAMGEDYKGGSALTIRHYFNGWGQACWNNHWATDTRPEGLPHPDDVRVWVYSYATPIGAILKDGTVWQNPDRYSVTTSGHQRLCRAWLGKGERVY